LLTGLIVILLLFLGSLGTVFGVKNTVLRDAVWALLLTLVSVAVAALFFRLSIPRLGVIYTLMVPLLTIMRFGMERADAGRRRPYQLPVEELEDKVRAWYFDLPAESPLARFLGLKITNLPAIGRVTSGLIRISSKWAVAKGMGGDAIAALKEATTVVLDVDESPAGLWICRSCGILVVALGLGKAVYTLSGREAQAEYAKTIENFAAQELDESFVAGKRVGEYLAQSCAGQKALLLRAPPSQASQARYDRLIDGLSAGFGDKLALTSEQAVPGAPTGISHLTDGDSAGGGAALPGPLAEMKKLQEAQAKVKDKANANARVKAPPAVSAQYGSFSAVLFDQFVERNADCKAIICTAALPADLARMKLWRRKPEERPTLVLVTVPLNGLKELIKKGYIKAAVVYRQAAEGAPAEEAPVDLEQDYKKVFDKFFLLIDAENVDDIAGKLPGLFAAKE